MITSIPFPKLMNLLLPLPLPRNPGNPGRPETLTPTNRAETWRASRKSASRNFLYSLPLSHPRRTKGKRTKESNESKIGTCTFNSTTDKNYTKYSTISPEVY
jgi:hypothetical protein